jgi:heptosyltransferase-2
MKLFRSYDSPSVVSRLVMALSDLLSYLVIHPLPKPRLPFRGKHAAKILLLRLDGIGDNICSWPALQLLRQQFPDSTIMLATGPWAATLYRECPWIDELVEWDSELFGLFRGKGLRCLTNDRRMTHYLRGQSFDIGIDLRGDLLSVVLLWLIAPPIRTASALRGGKRLLTDPLHIPNGHEMERTIAVTRTVTGIPLSATLQLSDWPRPLASARAIEQLSAAGLDLNRPLAAFCPGALWPWKQWPRERFQDLARRLESELELQVVWISETEGAQGNGGREFCFAGSLDEVAAVLALCRLAVCNDSGLLHLAVAAGCATVQLFGPGDADRFAHIGPRLAQFHDRSCEQYPCVQRGTCVNLENGWCLEKISVDEVFAACRRLITASGE